MPAEILDIPVVKGGSTIKVVLKQVSDDVYEEALKLGFKHLINGSGMSKITKANLPEDEARKTEAMKVAEINLQKVYDGKIRFTTGKAKAVKSGVREINTEAMKEARVRVKAEAVRQGFKVSHLDAKDVTMWAKALLAHPVKGPPIWEKAEATVAERRAALEAAVAAAENGGADEGLGIGIEIRVSEKKVKQQEEKKARAASKKSGEPLSAKQASMPPPSTPMRPGFRPSTH